MTKKQAIDLMMEEPNLMKRPLVMRGENRAVFGWKPALYDEVLGE